MSEKKPQILIVDDAEDNRLVINDWLEDDFDVLQAENGKKAIQLLDRYKESLSMVLLDISLPELSGYDVLMYIKNKKTLNHLPVIAVTAHAREQDRSKALSYGFDDFLSKPFRFATLVQKIEDNSSKSR